MKFHDTEIRVRYEDADPMGVLHHAQYFSFFEIGRLDFFRARGGDYRAIEAAGIFVVVAKAECRYRKPARYDDLVTVRTIIHEITPAKIIQRYEMRRGDDLLAEGQVTLAVIDREGRVQRVPDWLRDTY
jgi:acyl-CoA thioester hydrolase